MIYLLLIIILKVRKQPSSVAHNQPIDKQNELKSTRKGKEFTNVDDWKLHLLGLYLINSAFNKLDS